MAKQKVREVVVITGASAGVGRATARAFAERGAHIGLVARGRDGLEAARREVEDAGGKALVLQADVSKEDEVEAAAEAVERELGPIDVWVNCAMTSVFSPVEEMKSEEYRRVMEVNFLGYVHGTMAALKRMRPRERGKIVQVSSALAFRGIPLQSAYCASKRAIIGFTESLITELLHDKSRVSISLVHMPGLNTPQFEWVKSRLPKLPQPMPPFYEPEVAARAIVWAADHDRRDVTVGAPTVATIFGNKVAPKLLDKQLAKSGFKKQQTSQPVDPNRADNLWAPVPGDHGARGPFEERAKSKSVQLWANTHRGALSAAGLCAAGLAAVVLAERRQPSWLERLLAA